MSKPTTGGSEIRLTDEQRAALARSLTPQRDLASIMLAHVEKQHEHETKLPGVAGAQARLRFEIVRATQMAVSLEEDMNSCQPSELVIATVQVLAEQIAAQILTTLRSGDARQKIGQQEKDELARVMLDVAGRHAAMLVYKGINGEFHEDEAAFITMVKPKEGKG